MRCNICGGDSVNLVSNSIVYGKEYGKFPYVYLCQDCKASPHEYRRFFARQMYDATHDEALIKGLLGHENLKTTSRYIKKTERQAMHLYARSQNW